MAEFEASASSEPLSQREFDPPPIPTSVRTLHVTLTNNSKPDAGRDLRPYDPKSSDPVRSGSYYGVGAGYAEGIRVGARRP